MQRWLREGRLPAIQVGSHMKVDASALTPALPTHRIERLLVANSGELVVRIARTCRQLGVRCLALVPDDQARAWWTSAADEIVPLNGSYLDKDAIITAARLARADAIHPGYGFLAENAEFAEAVVNAGLIWIGPPAAAMRALGDKASARRLATSLRVPVLPGYDGEDESDERLSVEAERVGYPVLVKPSAGGGGKGMHVVTTAADLSETLPRSRREAAAAFGDERLILERYLPRPRHVEVQLLADAHGNAVHLGERECTLQRRHQKVVEECPSPAVDSALRSRLGDAALTLARAARYVGAGTAEFLLDEQGDFYFLEVNARLQVEHPVTELVTGRDLVADQIAIANGERLPFMQADIRFDGHAIEARLYAEDPYADFVPAVGEVIATHWPRLDGIRIDAGIGDSDVIGTRYDPLVAKVVARGADRPQALDLLAAALNATHILGVTTNRGFLLWLLEQGDVVSGDMYTSLIDDRWRPAPELPIEAWDLAAAALAHVDTSPSGSPLGFRLNAAARLRVEINGEELAVEPERSLPEGAWTPLADDSVVIDVDGRSVTARLALAPNVDSAARHAAHEGAASQRVVAPMPGSVLSVRVADGDMVEAGQVLVVLEAMKMENTVPAPGPGRVERVLVAEGQQVQRGEPLVELA